MQYVNNCDWQIIKGILQYTVCILHWFICCMNLINYKLQYSATNLNIPFENLQLFRGNNLKFFEPRNLRQNGGLFYLTHYFGFPLQMKKETLGIVPTRSKQTLGAKTISLHLNFLFLLIITFNKIKATSTILIQWLKYKQSFSKISNRF